MSEIKLDMVCEAIEDLSSAWEVMSTGIKMIEQLELNEDERKIAIWQIYSALANNFEDEMWDDMRESVKKLK